MAHDYTGTPDDSVTEIPLPDDNDLDRAAAFNPAYEACWNAILGIRARGVPTVITASDPTYEPDLDGATWVHFLIVGGGGAGAYATNAPLGGGGGGAGAIVDVWIPASEVPASLDVVIGAGGATTSSGTPENDGGFSAVSATGFNLSAPGGTSGQNSAAGGPGGIALGEFDPDGGAAPGVNGEGARRGVSGAGGGSAGDGTPLAGGDGGRSAYGFSGGSGGAVGANGSGGRGYGAGGGGVYGGVGEGGGGGGAGGFGVGLIADNASNTNGGAGADGVVIITIYKGQA